MSVEKRSWLQNIFASHIGGYLRLGFYVFGIYFFFLTWGVYQEKLSTTKYSEGKPFSFFIVLNLVQALGAALASFVSLKGDLGKVNMELFRRYTVVAFLNCIASPFGYESLKHINYPTMILGKTCKLVPVVAMNFLIFRKTYPPYKYLCVLLVTVGVSAFFLLQESKKKGDTQNSLFGLFLLAINLMIDGATNSTQDEIFRKFKGAVTGLHMMFFMNALSSLYMTIYLLILPGNTELVDTLAFMQASPAVIYDLIGFALCGALGQIFIFTTLEHFGSVALVTITVTRKLFTILLSVFRFGHQISPGQWGAVTLVFTGIGLEAYVKEMESKEKKSNSVNGSKSSLSTPTKEDKKKN